jgi:hypothetical protein
MPDTAPGLRGEAAHTLIEAKVAGEELWRVILTSTI